MFNQLFGGDNISKMARWAAGALFFLSIFLVVKTIGEIKRMPTAGREVYPQSTIMVTGSGEAYAVPDVATFNFSVVETGGTVKQAQEKADAKMNKALSAIRESGVEDKDIKTTGYNVYPKYEYSSSVCSKTLYEGMEGGVPSPAYCPPGKQVLTGYEVNQTITVKVRDTAKAGDLVTKVGALGASNISGIEFTVDQREKYEAQARDQAIAEAKQKAKDLAKQLGVRLGKIMYYNDMGNYPMYYGEGKGGGMDMGISSVAPRAAELPKGESKITSNISITYEIK